MSNRFEKSLKIFFFACLASTVLILVAFVLSAGLIHTGQIWCVKDGVKTELNCIPVVAKQVLIVILIGTKITVIALRLYYIIV